MARFLRSTLVLTLILVGSGRICAETLYRDVTETHIPLNVGKTMDASMADVDDDGDLDIILAMEYTGNILLINDGSGSFTDESAARLPNAPRDSEDAGVADVDDDGDVDLIFVSEDDFVNELYLNNGEGRFSFASGRIGDEGRSNALAVADINDDGHVDLLIGNHGFSALLLNDGRGFFILSTDRFPARASVTQDVEFGDVDGDGDLDVIEANEGDNFLLLNNGAGFFSYADGRIPIRSAREETREADFGDVDCDGDLDLYFANTRLFVAGADPSNRLLINDGTGRFTDETSDRLPNDEVSSFEIDFLDVDCDGDLDIITGNGLIFPAAADSKLANVEPYKVFLNDGFGFFVDGTSAVFPATARGIGFDVAAGDVNGDGAVDLYLAGRETRDRLLLATRGRGCERPVCLRPAVRSPAGRVAP